MVEKTSISFKRKLAFRVAEKASLAKHLSKTAITGLLLSACGKNETVEPQQPSQEVEEPSQTVTLTHAISSGTEYTAQESISEVLEATYTVLKTKDTIADTDYSDNDQLIIFTSEDIPVTPEITGFEKIIFTIQENFTKNDTVFDAELGSISEFSEIAFDKSSSSIALENIIVTEASGNLNFGDAFSNITVNALLDENINLHVAKNSDIVVANSPKNLSYNGYGKSLVLDTSNTGSIDILEVSSLTLNAPNALESINITSNGKVIISDAGSLKGNVSISAVGIVNIDNIASVEGKLDIDNLRSLPGDDIVIKNAINAKSVDIESVGSVIATGNNGFNAAETIKIVAADNSSIYAASTVPRVVTLNADNKLNSEVVFDIEINSITNLSLGGSSPILVKSPGSNLNATTITSTNSAGAAVEITPANVDLSNFSSAIQVRLDNFDGRTISVGQNQNIAFDAEIAQTSNVSTPTYNFITDATSLTTNTIAISTIDTKADNSSNTSVVAGLSLKDIQVLKFDLASDVNFQTSQNIVGDDLQRVEITGSGDFTLDNSTIVGGANSAISLDASNFSGVLTATIDNTESGLKTLTTGSGNDLLTINGISSSSPGITINSGSGNDTISLTSNSDGSSAFITINGGDGTDTVNFASALDYSLGNINLTEVEKLVFIGGVNPVKLPSNLLSTKNYNIAEDGTGTLTLDIFPDAQVINLSSLEFDSSVVTGTDKITLNGLNFTQALTITGTILGDEITGTHTSNDTISSGDGNDTIDGSDGNDILTPGNGADHVTSGIGNDTINLTEVVGAVDTLHYKMDAGAGNVDTISSFDVRVANDIISLDVSEPTTPITFGNGSAAGAAAAGTISIYDQPLDTDLNYSTNAAASIIKLTQTDKSTFATALGDSLITVADNSTINFLWYDVDTSEAVFGYSHENTDTPAANTIKAEDGCIEIARLAMSSSTYLHYLDADNFAFV